MKRYQVYGIAVAGGIVTHAGVHVGRKISEGVARKIQCEWLRWRKGYLAENPGDFPLRRDAQDPERETVAIVIHEVGFPEQAQRFDL